MNAINVKRNVGIIDNAQEKERVLVTLNEPGVRRVIPEISIKTPRAVGEIERPSIEIELRMTKGTVKFFNETKILSGGKIIDVAIKVNGQDV